MFYATRTDVCHFVVKLGQRQKKTKKQKKLINK